MPKELHFKSKESYRRYLAYGYAHKLFSNQNDKIYIAGRLAKPKRLVER